MKIAMIGVKGIPAKWGGMEKYVEEVGKRLVQRGHEVTVFSSRWYCSDYKQKEYLGMRICRLPTLHSQATDALTNALLASFVTAISRFDIVNFHGYASYLFVPFLQKLGKICVVTAHGAKSGWDNPKYGLFARTIIKEAFRVGTVYAQKVVTVATHLKRQIKQEYGVDAELLTAGVDEAVLRPPQIIKEKYGLETDRYLLYLGRIDPIKRIDWVVDLNGLLKEKLKLVIAGGAQDSSSLNYLGTLKQSSGNRQNIIFTGPVAGQEKAELLSNCLALLSPSRDEGLPVTVLEAASYGKCIVASNIDAHIEVIVDGESGFLFSREDKSSFVEAVNGVIGRTPQERARVGSKARKSVTQSYSWDNTTARYETIYRAAINAAKAD